jgi:hypothetical protein
MFKNLNRKHKQIGCNERKISNGIIVISYKRGRRRNGNKEKRIRIRF